MDQLTPRQGEIARLLALGLTQRQIAHRLQIKAGTVYRHTNDMRRRTRKTTGEILVSAALEIERGR